MARWDGEFGDNLKVTRRALRDVGTIYVDTVDAARSGNAPYKIIW